MGIIASIRAGAIAMWSGIRHFFKPRMTLKYPEQKMDLEGSTYPIQPRMEAGLPAGYKFDPRQGVGLPGFKGRHFLREEKCTGCQLCAIACDGVAVAIDMQVLTRKKPQNKKDLWPAVDYGRCVFCGLCIEPSTEIATNPGMKAISQIVVGDMVLTHSGDYRPVTKLWNMVYTGQMYKIHVFGKPEPLICTADHPILAVSRPVSSRKDRRLLRVKSPLLFHKPGELKVGDYLVSPIVKKVVPISRYYKDVQMYRGGNTTRPLSLAVEPDLFRLVGYYLAEGSCSGGRTVYFDFNIKEVETYVKDCDELVRRFFGKPCLRKPNGSNGIRLALNSALAEDFFSQFGKAAQHKTLPDWVFFAEPEKQLELLRGEWQGDGCRIKQPRQEYLNFTTTSRTLAYQLQAICARVGVVSTIDTQSIPRKLQTYRVNVFGRWALKLADMWRINLDHSPTKHADKFQMDENYVYLPIRKIEVEEVQEHRVMDVTVKDNHTFAPLGLATSNCVDACPFDALYMTNDYELSAYDRAALKFTPEMLMVPPKIIDQKYKLKVNPEKGEITHG